MIYAVPYKCYAISPLNAQMLNLELRHARSVQCQIEQESTHLALVLAFRGST